jgi:hypothetical protein
MLCARGRSSAGAPAFFRLPEPELWCLLPHSGWDVRMTRNVTISKNYRWLQIMAALNLLKVHYSLKSYLLCQTISPFSATANGQIAIRHYVCDLYIYLRKSCKLQASCFDTLSHDSLPWGQN